MHLARASLTVNGHRLGPDDALKTDAPMTIADHATFEKPHQYATGVHHVFANGVHVLNDGQRTGAKPGRVVRGTGYQGGKKIGSEASRAR